MLVKQPIIAILFYIIAIPFIIGSHRIDPTNLAGPGLDLLAFFVSLLLSFYCFVKSIMNAIKLEKNALVVTSIHTLGFTGILILLFIN
jgi:hypothetical protein